MRFYCAIEVEMTIEAKNLEGAKEVFKKELITDLDKYIILHERA
jgi:hypothetical protein